MPMGYEWPQHQYDALPPFVRAVRALLQDWYVAMEDGTVGGRMPDPLYPVEITAESVEKVIAHIDERFAFELQAWAHQESAGSYTIGPEFHRLAPPQRLALCQQLHALKLQHVPEAATPRPEPAYYTD